MPCKVIVGEPADDSGEEAAGGSDDHGDDGDDGDSADDDGILVSADTLHLPGHSPVALSSGDERVDALNDADVDMRDSQSDSWWGPAYQYLCQQDKVERKVVPIEVLYQWMVDTYPSQRCAEYQNTFTRYDLR